MIEEKVWKELNYVEMGQRIRGQREFSGMTREELAYQVDVSSKFIADVEYGEKGVSIRRLYLLTQALDISADYILAGEQKMSCGDAARACIEENILGSLERCSTDQLQCLEQIIKFYVKAVNSEE